MGTLPAELTSFVGRRQELVDIRALLADGRLVTLTGTGGVGKSRLALRAAAQVRRTFPDGVWLVELAAIQDVALLAKTIGMSFGLRDTDDDPARRLIDFLRDRSLLLVLDNCEYLADACAELVSRLLPAAPGVRVLATSRHVLGVAGERVYSVPPLAVGEVRDLADAMNQDVVRLFTDRAAAASVDFAVNQENWSQIVEVCRRLDGIPLGVELAAAWMRILSVDDLLDRLDTSFDLVTRGRPVVPSRQQTLAATIDWSHDLCTARERTLWARLSVFAGGFDLSAAEEVCSGDDFNPLEVLEVLALLVDKSIVQPEQEPGQTRFHLLETIRQYGLAKLRAAGGEDAVRELHRDHYLRLAEQCRRDWDRGSGQAEAYARTRPEHANLRSALEFSLSTPGQEAIGLRLAVALHYFWLFCGHAAEGRRWLERALQLNPGPSQDRANALWITAFALSRMGYAATIYSYSREAESWARENGDDDVLAHALLVLGGYYFLSGEIEKSAPLFHQAMSRLEALGETSSFLLQLHSAAAQAESWQGQVHEGLAIAARGLELCDVTGEQYARSALLFASALSHWMLGEYEEAVKGVTEGIRLAQTFNDVLGAVTRLELLCWTTAAMRHFVRAAELLGVANEIWAMGGGRSMLGSLQMTDAHDTCEREVLEALGPQRYQEAFNRGVAAGVEFNQAITFAVGPVATDAGPADAVRSAGSRRPGSLSEREYQVAELVAQGLTNKEIAQQLVISRRTAESHVVHILDKLGFSSRSQIATWLTTHQL